MSGRAVVELDRVAKSFGGSRAVDSVSLQVFAGEFFSLLGPSGCGKTTTLRLIAGFETPDPGGRVLIDGAVVNDRRPYERGLGMVFQSYALFPHLSVRANVGFGLERRRLAKAEIAGKVDRALDLVRLDPAKFGSRGPAELSGGQRQRVALARALVLEPTILLLDEPLGALDLKLRKAMQLELKALNRSLGVTFIYVTHDQEEALTMSDRIAVMADGRIAQLGNPAEIYEDPRTEFVARFIGEANVFAGRAGGRDGTGVSVESPAGRFRIPAAAGVGSGASVKIAVRPEWLDLFARGAAPPNENAIDGQVRDVIYLGETIHVLVALPDGSTATVALRNEGQLTRPIPWTVGTPVSVAWLPEDCQVLAEDG